jgi:hypothetical protein
VNFGLSVASHLLQIDLEVADLTNRLPDALAKHFIEARNHCGVITAQARMVMKRPMVAFLTQLLLAIRSRFTSRARLEAENLLLRQQLVVLRRKSPTRVRLWNIDRLLLLWLYRPYPSLLDAIIIVQPETVIRWL